MAMWPHRQWLADALKENDPSNVILFLVGSKKDLSVSVSPSRGLSLCRGAVPIAHPCSLGRHRRSTARWRRMRSKWPRRCRQSSGLCPHSQVGTWPKLEGDGGEVTPRWSSGVFFYGAGENVRDFFFRVAALTFESSVLAELERGSARRIGDAVREYSQTPPPWLSPHPPTYP